jgi:hypothetical protein
MKSNLVQNLYSNDYVNNKISKLKLNNRSYNYKKSILCYYSKGNYIDLNNKVIGFSENKPLYKSLISCSDLSFAYIKNKKPAQEYFNSIDTKEKLQQNPFFMQAQYDIDKKTNICKFAYYFDSDTVHIILLKLVEKNWGDASYQEKFFFLSFNHLMALKIKNKNDKTTVIYFYDPNDTIRHKKYVISNLNDTLNLTIEEIFSNKQLTTYFTVSEPYAAIYSHRNIAFYDVTITSSISPTLFTKICSLGHSFLLNLEDHIIKEDKYRYYVEQTNGYPVIFLLFAYNYTQCLKKIMLDILYSNDFSINEQVYLLEAEKLSVCTGFSVAIFYNNIEIVNLYIELILTSNLPSEYKIQLLAPIKTDNIYPGVSMAFYLDLSEIVEVFFESIINSSLNIKDRLLLLNCMKQDGQKGIFISCVNEKPKSLTVALDKILHSTLNETAKVELIKSTDINGNTALYIAFANN